MRLKLMSGNGGGDSKWKDVFFPDWRVGGLFIIQELNCV